MAMVAFPTLVIKSHNPLARPTVIEPVFEQMITSWNRAGDFPNYNFEDMAIVETLLCPFNYHCFHVQHIAANLLCCQ
jgi:hypothetical protein